MTPPVSPGPTTASVGAREPALTTAGYTALATMAVNALISYGAPITLDLKLLLVSLVGVLGPAVTGILVRAKVFSPAEVTRLQVHWADVAQASGQQPTTRIHPNDP